MISEIPDLQQLVLLGLAMAGIFYVIVEKRNRLNSAYTYLLERWAPRIPIAGRLFSCIFCMSFWVLVIIFTVRGVPYFAVVPSALVTAVITQMAFNLMLGK